MAIIGGLPLAAEVGFRTFGPAHLWAIAATLAFSVALAGGVNLAGLSHRRRWQIARGLAVLLVANELVYYGWHLVTGTAWGFVSYVLPLHLCGAAVFLIAWAAWRRSWRACELAYFWGIGGTLQALLTPNLQEAFPHYHFFQYFIVHGGIIVAVVYLTASVGLRPRRGAVLRVFGLTNAYMLAVAGINVLLRRLGFDANYMFLCRPPKGASPFFFWPWPWYILFLEGVGLVLLIVLYLPWFSRNRRALTPGSGGKPR
jgi:hypothetical integral membrane protein (TIGR02206 family)